MINPRSAVVKKKTRRLVFLVWEVGGSQRLPHAPHSTEHPPPFLLSLLLSQHITRTRLARTYARFRSPPIHTSHCLQQAYHVVVYLLAREITPWTQLPWSYSLGLKLPSSTSSSTYVTRRTHNPALARSRSNLSTSTSIPSKRTHEP